MQSVTISHAPLDALVNFYLVKYAMEVSGEHLPAQHNLAGAADDALFEVLKASGAEDQATTNLLIEGFALALPIVAAILTHQLDENAVMPEIRRAFKALSLLKKAA